MSSKHSGVSALLVAPLLTVSSVALAQTETPEVHSSGSSYVNMITQKRTGDLDGMIQRRLIRALVVYSKTYYFIDRGTQHGISYEALKAFEDELNKELLAKKLLSRNLRLRVACIPVKRDDIIPALIEGRGDVAAAGLTITPGRERLVDFSDPLVGPVDEVVVTGPATPPIATLDDLSGREVFLRKSSPYYEHLQDINAAFAKAGKEPVKLRLAPESLVDEDLLEMLNGGLVQLVVVDRPVADFWAQVLPRITVHADVAVHRGDQIAWMFRKNSPKLRDSINQFIESHLAKGPTRNEILRKYLKSTKFVRNATSDAEMRKFQIAVELFKKYGLQYSFEYLLLEAQGYQESRLDQSVRSPVGAVGVMQVMPATGRSLHVGDIRQLEPNIHAGVAYITKIRDKYFGKDPMDEMNRDLFAFAAYNAGPARINRLRQLAAKRGLNPNVWFANVELLAAEKIGRETVTYVSNIFKYYVAYQLALENQAERLKAKNATTAP
jgi:membrane-bound lytic murein transglycosylase MltF